MVDLEGKAKGPRDFLSLSLFLSISHKGLEEMGISFPNQYDWSNRLDNGYRIGHGHDRVLPTDNEKIDTVLTSIIHARPTIHSRGKQE